MDAYPEQEIQHHLQEIRDQITQMINDHGSVWEDESWKAFRDSSRRIG